MIKEKLLKVIYLRDDIFYKILEIYSPVVQIKEDLSIYYHGYNDKRTIYYNGSNEFICQEYIINNFEESKECTTWKQVKVIKNNNMSEIKRESLSGTRAKAYINRILKKYYTEKEIDERLHMFEADYDYSLKQMHYIYPVSNKVLKITNTYKFDINGAHLDALCEIFPKAKDAFILMYNKRKKDPIYKQYPNLYVGMLAKKTQEMKKNKIPGKYEKTYNWIVQRTTKILMDAINYLNGQPVYINTDCILVKTPEKLIKASNKLGEFKLEFEGDTYFYKDKNYILYQFGDDKKGSCFTSIRDLMDLSKGEVIHYDILVTENKIRKPINIQKETLKIYEN